MSTQSLRKLEIEGLLEKVDSAIACISEKEIMKDKFGFDNKLDFIEIETLLYYKDLLLDNQCGGELTQEVMERINVLTSKVKI